MKPQTELKEEWFLCVYQDLQEEEEEEIFISWSQLCVSEEWQIHELSS